MQFVFLEFFDFQNLLYFNLRAYFNFLNLKFPYLVNLFLNYINFKFTNFII
jgi:hypothetical protein